MPLPPAFGTVTIVEDYVDFTGAVGTGTVTFIPVANDWLDMPGSNTIIVPKPITVGIDANGHMTITVPLTDDPDVVPTYTYSVTENVSGLSRTRTIEVPSALLPGPLVLSDLAPTNAGSVGTTALTKAEADAFYAPIGGAVDTSALLAKANNLSDVPNKATARGNLGLGTASTQPTSAFATSSDLTALSATSARSRTNVFAAIGTSITDQNKPFDQGGGAMAWTGAGYMHWANANLRQALTLLPEFGVSGDVSGQMLARIGDVIAAGPSMVLVETGPNDVQGDSTFENITTSLAGIYTALRNAGILVFAGHICPTETIMATSSRQLVMHRVNRWMNQYSRANRGVVVVPWAAPMTNPATGSYLAGTLQGSPLVHPNTYGASIMGKVLADTMAEYVTGIDTLPYSNTDPTNLIGNGLLLGSSSGVATGWTASSASSGVYTASKVARADGDPGEWQQLQVTSATGGVNLFSPIGTTYTPGTTVVAEIEVDPSSLSACTQLDMQCWAVDGSGFPPVSSDASLGFTDYFSSVGRSLNSRAVLRTYPLTIPASGVTGVRMAFSLAGPSTVRVSRASIKDVNA